MDVRVLRNRGYLYLYQDSALGFIDLILGSCFVINKLCG